MELHLRALMFLSGVVRRGRTTLVESVLRQGYGLGCLGFESPRGPEICLFSKSPAPSVGPTHPHIQRVPGFLPGSKAVGALVVHSTPSSDEIKNAWNYKSAPPCVSAWCGQL